MPDMSGQPFLDGWTIDCLLEQASLNTIRVLSMPIVAQQYPDLEKFLPG
jgi:hypothetical protein